MTTPTRGVAEGARLLALPMGEGASLASLRDDVEPDDVLDRVRDRAAATPGGAPARTWKLLGALGAGGYRDENLGLAGAIDYGEDHFTCFQFAYDWRRDLPENARRLHAFILEKRAYVQRGDGAAATERRTWTCASTSWPTPMGGPS